MDRVVAYIDGFNLYFGLKAEHGRKYLWLDLQSLVEGLLLPNQELREVQYFTARVRDDPDGSDDRAPTSTRWQIIAKRSGGSTAGFKKRPAAASTAAPVGPAMRRRRLTSISRWL